MATPSATIQNKEHDRALLGKVQLKMAQSRQPDTCTTTEPLGLAPTVLNARTTNSVLLPYSRTYMDDVMHFLANYSPYLNSANIFTVVWGIQPNLILTKFSGYMING